MSLFGPPNISELEKKGDVRGLIKSLRYTGRSDDQINADAIQALLRLAPLQAVDPLIAFIQDLRRDEFVRSKAIEALGELRDTRAFLPLVNCLKSGDYFICGASARALIKFDDPRLLPALLASHEKSYEIPPLAAQAMARYGEKSHIPLLISWLANENKKTREQAAIALDQLGWQPTNDESGAYYWLARDEYECCAKIGPRALMPMLVFSNQYKPIGMTTAEFSRWLIPKLCYKSFKIDTGTTAIVIRQVENNSILALIMADECISAPLLEIMHDPNEDLGAKVNAARLLAYMNDQRALEPLFSLLSSPHHPYAEEIIWAISTLRPSDIEPYLSLLNHENRDICMSAIHLLDRLGSELSINPLIALLDNDRYLDNIKYKTIITLEHIGDIDVIENLLQRLLKMNGPEAIHRALLIALKNKPDPRAFEPAYRILCDSAADHSTRLAAAELLSALHQDNQLDDNALNMLTPLRETIQSEHNDHYSSSDCGHTDNGKIGLDFPL